MSFIIKTAKTVEEAIQTGLLELNLERSEVEIEILEEPKTGFLGILGQRDAMVKIRKKEDISSFVRDILYEGRKEEAAKEVKEEVVKKEKPVKVKKKSKTRSEKKKARPEKKKINRVEKFETPLVEETKITDDIKIIEDNYEEEINNFNMNGVNIEDIWSDIEIKNNAEEFLAKILDEFGIEYSLILELKNNELFVNITSQNPSDLGIVIGKHGSTLDSLQYLLSQVINKHKEEFIRVTVDANEYRDKRKRNLERMAKRGVERVQRSGRSYKLEPMNSADRRIVHMALQNYQGISTHSEGRDPYRRVVISKNRK